MVGLEDFEKALKQGDRASVRQMLEREPRLLEAKTSWGVSPLMLAVYHGQTEVAHLLRDRLPEISPFEASALGDAHRLAEHLQRDPELHRRHSVDGFTPLGFAAYFGHAETVRQLLGAGADPNLASTNADKVAPLHSALAGGHKEIARMLVEAGADVNAASSAGYTPLHYVAEAGDIETAKFLIDHHAERDVKMADGRMPAELAEEKGFDELGELLRPVGS